MKPSGLNTPTFLDEEDDDQDDDSSSVGSSPFDQGGFLGSLDSVDNASGDGQPSSSAAACATAEGNHLSPDEAEAATAAAEAATPSADVPTDLSMAGPSMSSEVQHGYQLRWRIPRPPNAFMLFAQEKRRSVAAENPSENNQRVSTRLGKLWRSLSAADKEPYQRKAAEAAAVHRRRFPDYVYNPREARRRKEQERRAKAIAGKVKEDTSGDQELEAPSTSASLGPSTPEFQHLPHPPQSPPPLPHRHRRRATGATRASAQADGQTTPTGRPTAAVPATASARTAARPYNIQRLHSVLPPSLRGVTRAGTVTSTQPPLTYPRNQLSPLVACSRDCAAVPHPQLNGPGLPQLVDGSARQIGWFFDPNPQAAAAHMTVGVAAAPVLCWPVIAAAGPPALAPSLPFLLPAAVAPAVARPHFALPGPQVQPTRQEPAAGPASIQFFNAMQHEQQRNNANAIRNAPTGTSMPIVASRQQQIAGSRRSPAQAAASSAAAATLWPPAAAQAMQRQDMGGPFPSCAFAASHEMTGTAIPCPYTTQVCCTGAGAPPCNALVGASAGHGGGTILLGTPTVFQEPATIGSNQPPRGGPNVDRYHPRPMLQQQQQAVQQQQHTVGQQPQPSQLNLTGWQQPSWGGPFGPDVDLAMQMMIGRSAAQPQQQHPSTPTFSAAPGNAQQFRRPT
uniref:Transcription factor SOX1/3/14/21 (SOX group B) n=1 Tax=Rhipicephalus appendiculatus TaxID=34631 RepID=A0A131YXL9_RHIAP